METRAAAFIGRHFVESFLVVQACALLAVALLWSLRPHAMRWGSRVPRGRLTGIGAHEFIAASGLVAAALIFASLAWATRSETALVAFDVTLAATVGQEVSAGIRQAFSAVTRVADTRTLTVLCLSMAAWLWWRRERQLALLCAVAVAGNGALNTLLKAVFERQRPAWQGPVPLADGWSFPSGHSSGAAVICGLLAYLAARHWPPRWHLPLVLAAAAVAVTVGCSRIVLQVHYASDVLAGLTSGTAWLVLCISVVEWHRRRRLVTPESPAPSPSRAAP